MNDHVSLQPTVGHTAISAVTAELSQRAAKQGDVDPTEQVESPSENKSSELPAVIAQLREISSNFNRKLDFSIDEDSGRTVVRVTDPETEELIRQIPAEAVLKLSASLREMTEHGDGGMSGLLLQTET